MKKKKMNCTREKAENVAAMFGVSKDIVDKFEYKGNKDMENNSNYSETRIGKVIGKPADDENEPVMACVLEKDAEVGGIAVERLRSLIERIERLEEDKAGISSDIREVFAEAKSAGFDVKIMKIVLKLRKMNVADRDAQEYLTDTYLKALDC